MVIGNNDIHTELARAQNFLCFRDTTINRNQKLSTFTSKCFDSGNIHSVPFIVAMRNVYAHLVVSNLLEKIVEDDRPGDAIAIIVAKDDDILLFFECFKDAQNSTLHTKHKKRVVHVSLIAWIQELFSVTLCSNAPIPKKCLGKYRVVSKFVLSTHCGILSQMNASKDLPQ